MSPLFFAEGRPLVNDDFNGAALCGLSLHRLWPDYLARVANAPRMSSYPDASFPRFSVARAKIHKAWATNYGALKEVEQYISTRYEPWLNEVDAITGAKMASVKWLDGEPSTRTLRLELFTGSYLQLKLLPTSKIQATSFESPVATSFDSPIPQEFSGIQHASYKPVAYDQAREMKIADVIQRIFDAVAAEAQTEADALSAQT